MAEPHTLSFAPFRLDLRSQRLWQGREEVALKPKALAILRFLALHPQRMVSKADLMTAVWGETSVSPETLRSTLRELRRALQDDANEPRWIETVHGQGYRFVGTIEGVDASGEGVGRPPTRDLLVGRDDALARLRGWFAASRAGRRQVGFVYGEPGIGKTTIVEAFLSELRLGGDALCAHGQCVNGFGGREPYMPLLEALGRACRQSESPRWVELLERHAPTWLAEIPGLLEPAELRRLQRDARGANRDRMLRELVDAVEAISAERPLVLLLEDLHWSDPSTLDAVDVLARRTEPARVLILGTHRPVTTKTADGPTSALASMRAELHLHGLCKDLSLDSLDTPAMRAYLDLRFPRLDARDELAEFLAKRTGGNPLILASHANELVRTGRLVESPSGWRVEGDVADLGIPDGVRQMIEHQIDLLTRNEQRVLEGAAVAGVRFASGTVADADATVGDVEDHLLRLADGVGPIRAREDDLYEFAHALHQEILYDRIPPSRRRALHQRIGLALERSHRDDTAPVAAPLAMHFERAGDADRAVRYLEQTAGVAIQRGSHEDASAVVRRALELLAEQPDAAGRRQAEFGLLAKLGNCLTLTKGYVDPEVRDVFDRAVELSADVDEHTPDLMSVLAGLCGFYELRGDHEAAGEIARQQLEIAERTDDSYDRLLAGVSRAITCFSVGRYDEAARRLADSQRRYDAARHGPAAKPHPTDPGVLGLGHGSLVFGALGDLDRARRWSEDAIALSSELGHAPSQVVAYYYAMILDQLLRDVDRADADARACIALSAEHDFPYYIPAAMVVSGWVLARQARADEGVSQARQGVEILEEAGAVLGQPLYQSMLAEAYLEAGDVDAGLEAIASGLAIVEATGEITSESALHWLRGELLQGAPGRASERQVEQSLGRAVEVAVGLGARTQALGPAISLARLWSDRGRGSEARQLLERGTDGLTAASDVPLLEEARGLLAEL